jgi:hypothetical protein
LDSSSRDNIVFGKSLRKLTDEEIRHKQHKKDIELMLMEGGDIHANWLYQRDHRRGNKKG